MSAAICGKRANEDKMRAKKAKMLTIFDDANNRRRQFRGEEALTQNSAARRCKKAIKTSFEIVLFQNLEDFCYFEEMFGHVIKKEINRCPGYLCTPNNGLLRLETMRKRERHHSHRQAEMSKQKSLY